LPKQLAHRRKGGQVTAKYGHTVRVHYRGIAGRGIVFGTIKNGEPLEFTIGQGQVISGFEEAVVGMRVGEEKTVTIPMDKAFGKCDDDNVVVVKRDRFPRGLRQGQRFYIRTADARRAFVTVANISESEVTLNANHPFSGSDVTFKIILLEVTA
jgi:peptidylprolyl isomerase